MKSEEADNWQCVCVYFLAVCVFVPAPDLTNSLARHRKNGEAETISLSPLCVLSRPLSISTLFVSSVLPPF